jgi:predicted nucleic acid-binding Zn ribbon protein
MTTYIYETVPVNPDEKPKYYEIKQRMTDLPLFQHPETGEQIRRVVVGGLGVLQKGKASSSSSGHSCGSPGCC